MQIKPFKHKTGSTTWKLSCDNTVFDGDFALVFIVPNMKVRRLMLLVIHVDNDSVETADFGHNPYFYTKESPPKSGNSFL